MKPTKFETIDYVTVDRPPFAMWCEVLGQLATYAVLADDGVAERPDSDPVYREITFDLDLRSRAEKWEHPFSGCAYLPHWVYECAGLDHMAEIGRGTYEKPRYNPLARLAYHVASRPFGSRDTEPEPIVAGSTVQCGDDGQAHVCMLEHTVRDQTLPVMIAEYGQSHWEEDGHSRAWLRTVRHEWTGNRLYRGRRPVRRILSPAALWPHVAKTLRIPRKVADDGGFC